MSRSAVAICLLLALGVSCQIDRDLFNNIGEMVGAQLNIATLANESFNNGVYYKQSIDVSALDSLLTVAVQFPFGGTSKVISPYSSFKSLKYGNNAKVTKLIFENNINAGGAGWVLANALYGRRSGNALEIRSAFGVTGITAKPQFNHSTQRVCSRSMSHTSCRDVPVVTARGFFTHELNNILHETQRRAALRMRQSIGLGVSDSELSEGVLGGAFMNECTALRSLYREIIYEFTDILEANYSDISLIIPSASKNLIPADLALRITQWTAAQLHLNFLLAPNDRDLFFITARRYDSRINVHVSQFSITGARLPVGFFAINGGGGWHFERAGLGAAPSIQQIAAIFQGMRG